MLLEKDLVFTAAAQAGLQVAEYGYSREISESLRSTVFTTSRAYYAIVAAIIAEYPCECEAAQARQAQQ